MESTSISDVRRMCQRGAFRAYVQGGKVFLEDTATGQVVPLNGESGPANTERRAVPHREDRRGSRVERMFGARDTWKSADPDADQGPYRGFLIVQCEECGAIKAFCAKHETYGYKCGECGHETPLESQWADRYRMLSAESSAEPGRWHTDKAPYQREIMDAIGDAHIRRVVIMCAAQLGKTELLLNILGYFMA